MAKFTEEEKQYIKDNWNKTSMRKMAKHLGCSFIKVRSFMKKNNMPTGTFRKTNDNVETNVNPYRFF